MRARSSLRASVRQGMEQGTVPRGTQGRGPDGPGRLDLQRRDAGRGRARRITGDGYGIGGAPLRVQRRPPPGAALGSECSLRSVSEHRDLPGGPSPIGFALLPQGPIRNRLLLDTGQSFPFLPAIPGSLDALHPRIAFRLAPPPDWIPSCSFQGRRARCFYSFSFACPSQPGRRESWCRKIRRELAWSDAWDCSTWNNDRCGSRCGAFRA